MSNQYRNHVSRIVLLSPHYAKHISAMTAEDLYGKAEIAEELAHRDMQIEMLQEELDRVRSQFVAEVASIEAGANKIIDERMAQLAGGEAVGEVSGNDWSMALLYRDMEPGTLLYTAAPEIKQQVPEAKPLPELMMASYHEAIGWNACRDAMLAATPTQSVSANQPDSGKVPPGYALVPIEPTKAMHDAGVDADDSDFERGVGPNVSTIYRAMLAASPSAPIAEGELTDAEILVLWNDCIKQFETGWEAQIIRFTRALNQRLAVKEGEAVAYRKLKHGGGHEYKSAYYADAEFVKGAEPLYTHPVSDDQQAKDAARLDFLIANELQVWEVNGRYSVHEVTEHHPITEEFSDPRWAIDAVLSTTKQDKP